MKLLSLSLVLLPSVFAFFSSQKPTVSDTDLKVPGANPLEFCEDPIAAEHLLYIENVDLSPNPPQKGKNLVITATGNVTKEILDGAYVNILVKLGRFVVLRRTEDLCSQMKEIDKECPLKPGEMTVEKDVDLPAFIPPGKINVEANVYSVDDEPITCLRAQVEFPAGSVAAGKKDSADL